MQCLESLDNDYSCIILLALFSYGFLDWNLTLSWPGLSGQLAPKSHPICDGWTA